MALDTSGWTRADLVREAKLQTDAIQRLNVWLRIGYSLLALGFIVGYWGFYGGGGGVWRARGGAARRRRRDLGRPQGGDHQRQAQREGDP